jgi:hypothetical protein
MELSKGKVYIYIERMRAFPRDHGLCCLLCTSK